jgi:AcrR family transcriptional regulator
MAESVREAAGAERRREIVGSALEVFAEHGYKGASLADIAGRVGITQQAVLYHFGSKDRLLVEALDERDRQDREWWEETSESEHGSLDFLDLCERLVERNSQWVTRSRLLTILAADSTTHAHPAHDFFRGRYARLREQLGPRLAEANRDARRAGPSIAVVVAVLDGLQLQWLLDPETFDMAAEFRAFVASVRSS